MRRFKFFIQMNSQKNQNPSEGQIKIKGSLDSEVKVVSKPEMVRLRREANKKKNEKN